MPCTEQQAYPIVPCQHCYCKTNAFNRPAGWPVMTWCCKCGSTLPPATNSHDQRSAGGG